MSRLFVAIELSEDLKTAVTGTLHEMKKQGIKGNYVPIKNLHLTLAFIGETRETQAVKDALSGVKIKPFRLTFSELGCFGDVLWTGVKGNQGLTGAARGVREALSGAGISFDTQKFTPHVTLIRKVNGPWKKVPSPKGEMMVKSFALMKSEMKDGKRVYTKLASFG